MAYSIVSAIESNIFDQVVVSTDSEEIKNISEYYGANVPFIRPSEYSQDKSLTYSGLKTCFRFL